MREQDHGQYKFFIGDDLNFFYKVEGAKATHEKDHMKEIEFMFAKRRIFTELIKAWGRAHHLTGCKILETHGDYFQKQWMIAENHKSLGPVQNWINEHDGTVTALMVTACNPRRSKLFSKHSLVFYPSRMVSSLPGMIYTQGLIRVFVPGMGYMEKDYRGLRKMIDKLELQIGRGPGI